MQFPPLPRPTTKKFCLTVATSVTAEPKTQWLNFPVKEKRTNTHTHTKKASVHFPHQPSGARSPCISRPPLSLFCCKYPGRGRLNITFAACPSPIHFRTGWWLQAAQMFSSPSKDKSEAPTAGPGQAARSDQRCFSHCWALSVYQTNLTIFMANRHPDPIN